MLIYSWSWQQLCTNLNEPQQVIKVVILPQVSPRRLQKLQATVGVYAA